MRPDDSFHLWLGLGLDARGFWWRRASSHAPQICRDCLSDSERRTIMASDIVRGLENRLQATLIGFRTTTQSKRRFSEAFNLHVIDGRLGLGDDDRIAGAGDGIFEGDLNDLVF